MTILETESKGKHVIAIEILRISIGIVKSEIHLAELIVKTNAQGKAIELFFAINSIEKQVPASQGDQIPVLIFQTKFELVISQVVVLKDTREY